MKLINLCKEFRPIAFSIEHKIRNESAVLSDQCWNLRFKIEDFFDSGPLMDLLCTIDGSEEGEEERQHVAFEHWSDKVRSASGSYEKENELVGSS